jgi:hypothetical protein
MLALACRGSEPRIEAATGDYRNPVEWTFAASPDRVHACFASVMPQALRLREACSVVGPPDAPSPVSTLAVCRGSHPTCAFRSGATRVRPGSNDYFINPLGETIGLSEAYALDGVHLPYRAGFFVTVGSGSPVSTTVHVDVALSQVFAARGRSILHHSDPSLRDVTATTIDEYRVLRWLGQCLGVLGAMPPLKLPPGVPDCSAPDLR